MEELSRVVDSPTPWILTLGVLGAIVVQTPIHVRAARRAGPQLDLSREDGLPTPPTAPSTWTSAADPGRTIG